jgi:hypothetical protein
MRRSMSQLGSAANGRVLVYQQYSLGVRAKRPRRALISSPRVRRSRSPGSAGGGFRGAEDQRQTLPLGLGAFSSAAKPGDATANGPTGRDNLAKGKT